MTRLSRLHPYPAMIADSLATELAERFAGPGVRVLDPFCGSGRTLVSCAERGAICVGIDVNPLGRLVTRAKFAPPTAGELTSLAERASLLRPDPKDAAGYDLEPGRLVQWFSSQTKAELAGLLRILSSPDLSHRARMFGSVLLSATAREVSYCRKDGWKLHRLSPTMWQERSAKEVFLRRLKAAMREISALPVMKGRCRVLAGDAREAAKVLRRARISEPFDLVVTSPPYGDSRTTVDYGAVSSLCLGVVASLQGIEFAHAPAINASCLGGRSDPQALQVDVSEFWHGGADNHARARVAGFVLDFVESLKDNASLVRPGGYVAIVVGKRRVGGWRLHLDRVVLHVLNDRFSLIEHSQRKIENKLIHNRVRSDARSRSARIEPTLTMNEESVLIFRKRKGGGTRKRAVAHGDRDGGVRNFVYGSRWAT